MEELDMKTNVLAMFKNRIIQNDVMFFQNLTPEGVYSDYIMKSNRMLKELDEMRIKFRNRGQWTALVAGIKQKKEIIDGVIKLGQEFGFIPKKDNELKISGEMSFHTMSLADVRKEVEAEKKRIERLASGGRTKMRHELLGITDAEVSEFLPSSVIDIPQQPEKRIKKKVKLKYQLKKRV